MARLRLVITGQVQGVGFRPHVYRIAQQLQLTGWVQNSDLGVVIELQAIAENFAADWFTAHLTKNLPPLARIDTIHTLAVPCVATETGFHIVPSDKEGQARTMIAADTCVCDACLQELFDPQSRYYRYPFLNCTHCGPRLTITEQLPYDRAHTAMRGFSLCAGCAAEYADPSNRRYHAQPTACAHCGPQLSLPIDAIAKALSDGEIVAIKSLGGYQLVCDARNEKAVSALRERKNRPAKPFAIMLLNVVSASQLVDLNAAERALLQSAARPIVLLKKSTVGERPLVAPGLAEMGVMLPSTPLHYLLWHALAGYPEGLDWLERCQSQALVVTSANASGNPLVIAEDAAVHELGEIADKIVSYNRDIVTRADDSVVRCINHKPLLVRRARGFCPTRILLPKAIPATLGLGGHLKNTFCITRGNEAFVSQHIGNLTNKATLDFFHESLQHWLRFLAIRPERVACDAHPDFYTTQLAHVFAEQDDLPILAVQHHHAHLAAVVAEHGVQEPVLGLALEGYGYGEGGQSWGGELLLLDQATYQRLGHLTPLPQPGGEVAVREPWRMAAAVLSLLGRVEQVQQLFAAQPAVSLLAAVLKNQVDWPVTSSAGRLFDVASALLGVTAVSTYEGQAAMQLESLVTQPEVLSDGWVCGGKTLNFLPLLEALLGRDAVSGANLFHGTLIAGLIDWVMYWSNTTAIRTIVCSGGCFLNRVLTEGLTEQLSARGITVYLPQALPPNDGGLSLGQAWVAGIGL